MKCSFASDNNASVHPAVLEAISRVNHDYEHAYGYDSVTAKADGLLRAHFGEQATGFFVFGGTGCNVLAIRPFVETFHAIICSDCSHIHMDECGAPELFTNTKLLTVPSTHGKISAEEIVPLLKDFGVEHHIQPRIISITQSTECGTLYTPDEIRHLANLAHQHNMLLHVDGARLANAAAALGCTMKAITTDCDVDVVSLGGTKNGLMLGECILFLREVNAERMKYFRKQGMQLAAKMRYIAAQFIAYLTDDLWLTNARHANAMASRLYRHLKDLPGIQFTHPVQANHLFAILPPECIDPLQKQFPFYVWDETTHEVRWMTSFQTREEDVDRFAKAIQAELRRP